MLNQIILLVVITYLGLGCVSFFGVYFREQNEKKELRQEAIFIIVNWINMVYFIQGLTHRFGNRTALDVFSGYYKRRGIVVWGRNTIEMIRN